MKKLLALAIFSLFFVGFFTESALMTVQANGEYLELKKYSSHYHYGNGTSRFSQRAGDKNVWDGENYQYFIWNDIEKSVKFADTELLFYDWYTEVKINDIYS